MPYRSAIRFVIIDALKLAFLMAVLCVLSIGYGGGHVALGNLIVLGDAGCQAILICGLALSGAGFILPLVRPEFSCQPPRLEISPKRRLALWVLSFSWPVAYAALTVPGPAVSGGHPSVAGPQVFLLACAAISIACVVLVRSSRPAPDQP